MTQAAQSATPSPLDYSRGKQLAMEIFLHTMAALDLRAAMLAKLKREGDCSGQATSRSPSTRPPRVVAFGKAANRMAVALDEILGGRIEAGVCVSPGRTGKEAGAFPLFPGRPSLSRSRGVWKGRAPRWNWFRI